MESIGINIPPGADDPKLREVNRIFVTRIITANLIPNSTFIEELTRLVPPPKTSGISNPSTVAIIKMRKI